MLTTNANCHKFAANIRFVPKQLYVSILVNNNEKGRYGSGSEQSDEDA